MNSNYSKLRNSLLFGMLLFPASCFALACSVSTTSVAFGNYDVFSISNDDSTGSIVITCDAKNTPVSVALNAGATPGASINNRLLNSPGADKLQYNLYTSTARTIIWGDGVTGSTVSATTGVKNAPLTLTVYGRVFARQNVSASNYSDTVTVTVNY